MNLSKNEDVTVDQKARCETKKEKEQKRRFIILSGSIKPIQTSFHLKAGEKAYYEFHTVRLADREYIKSYTQGQARSPFIKGGILRGNTKIDTTTNQIRLTENEGVDSGQMILTNKRVLFVGKEVVSIPYEDILTIYFDSSRMTIKYPQMLKGESYSIMDAEPELYYKGIQRLIGSDTSILKLDDVQIDWPEYKEPKEKSSGSQWYKSSIVTILLLIFFFPAGLFTLWKFTKWKRGIKWIITGIGSFVYIIFIIGASSSPVQQAPAKPTTNPVKTQKVVKANVTSSSMTPVQAYIMHVKDLSFDQMDSSSYAKDITNLGVNQVKSDVQDSLKTSQGILNTLHALSVPQEMAGVQTSLVAGVNESITANTVFLKALTNNNISEITSAKNTFSQADVDIAQGENLLFAYEQQQFGQFATVTFDFNGVTMKNNFDVSLTNCTILLEASEKHWSDPWDYEEDEQATANGYYINIPAKKSLSVKWEHITNGNDTESFSYPPDKQYDVQFSCDIFNQAEKIVQTMMSQ